MVEVASKHDTRPSFFWPMVEESLDEAEFLWTRWERFLDSHELSLAKVDFWVEQRLRGALDGVRVAGDAAIEALLEPALASDAPGRVAAAAYVLASLATARSLELLRRGVESFSGASLDAIRRGAERCEDPRVLAALAPLLRSGSPDAQAAVLDLHVARGADPGALGMALLESSEPAVHAAALRAARCSPEASTGQVLHGLASSEPAVVMAAIDTGLCRGSADAWQRCLQLLQPTAAAVPYRSLLPVLAVSGAARAQRQLLQLLEHEALRRDAAFALGLSGRVEAAEACVALMRAGHSPRVAADSFGFITGLDLGAAQLIAPEAPPPTAASFEDDDLDAQLVPSLDDALPLPDVERVARWWQQHAHAFAPDTRYLRGRVSNAALLHRTLVDGPAGRRHELARELAIRSAGTQCIATRAFAREQRRQLARAATLDPGSLTHPPGWEKLA